MGNGLLALGNWVQRREEWRQGWQSCNLGPRRGSKEKEPITKNSQQMNKKRTKGLLRKGPPSQPGTESFQPQVEEAWTTKIDTRSEESELTSEGKIKESNSRGWWWNTLGGKPLSAPEGRALLYGERGNRADRFRIGLKVRESKGCRGGHGRGVTYVLG